MALSSTVIWKFPMNQEKIEKLLKDSDIRIKVRNPAEARACVDSAKRVAGFAITMRITEDTATIIFREIYESIRQLGDALWILEGYEAQTHDATIALLKELDIFNNAKLQFLDRYKQIRHDANYRGVLASVEQAKEIIECWNACSGEIIERIEEKLKEKPKHIRQEDQEESSDTMRNN